MVAPRGPPVLDTDMSKDDPGVGERTGYQIRVYLTDLHTYSSYLLILHRSLLLD